MDRRYVSSVHLLLARDLRSAVLAAFALSGLTPLGCYDGTQNAAGGGTGNGHDDGGTGGDENGTGGGTATGGSPEDVHPAEFCPPEYALPRSATCDGTLLLDPANVAETSVHVTPTPGPDGADAFLFENDGFMELGADSCLQLGQNGEDFTVSMWFRRPDPNSPDTRLFGTGHNGPNGRGFSLELQVREGEIRPLVYTGGEPGTQRITEGPWVTELPWNHIALTYRNRSQVEIMFNGVPHNLEQPGQFAVEDVLNEGVFSFGDGQGYHGFGSVEISEAKGYRRALSDAELRALYFEHAGAQGLSEDRLKAGLAALTDHFSGLAPLDAAGFDAAVDDVLSHSALLPRTEGFVAALDLIDAYERNVGPLFMVEQIGEEISQQPEAGESDLTREARRMVLVHQAIFDHTFHDEVVEGCEASLNGRSWQTSAHFPGAVQPHAQPASHTVPVDATKPDYFGRPVAFADIPGRRATGLYLPPGRVAEVTVPAHLAGKGYNVLVGAHTHIQDTHEGATRAHRRLPNVAKRFEIIRRTTRVANPMGGGIYIEVPYLADGGLVDVTVTNVVESPLFSLRSFDSMTDEQWQTRREAPGPWADFVTDKYMMQVPRNWIYAFEDPTTLMQDYDAVMDGFTELFGWKPEERNELVLYMQVDAWIRHGHGGVGYPQINMPYTLSHDAEGNSTNAFLTNPTLQLELHELGHAQLFTKFRGETEAVVNFPMAYVLTEKFDVDFDTAFALSLGDPRGGTMTPDNAAIHWMVTENFRAGAEMDYSNTTKDEMRYQHRGYAKYADMARVFGWDMLKNFFRAEHLAHEIEVNSGQLLPHETDDRILRLSIEARADLTPLIHFWGIHPVDPVALADAIAAEGLPASRQIEDLLYRYRTLIPADNAAFRSYYREVYPEQPEGGNPDYGHGWFNVWKDRWNEAHAQDARNAVDDVIALYFR